MKINEIKHNHSLTDLLKVIIFSLLMFAPLLSIATRCLYVICNKNAYQSYYGETINQKEYISYNSYNEIKEYTEINIETNRNITTFTNVNNNSYIEIKDLDNIDSSFAQGKTQLEENKNNIIYIYTLNNANNNPYLSFRTNSTNIITNIPLQDFTFSCTCTFVTTNDSAIEMLNYIYSIEYNSYSYLDNVFEYSVNKLEDNQLFNWTKNTAVYTGVNAMTTQLQIEGAVIPILITYWFLLTIIYVIIDIVLKLFTILTHMIGNRKA